MPIRTLGFVAGCVCLMFFVTLPSHSWWWCGLLSVLLCVFTQRGYLQFISAFITALLWASLYASQISSAALPTALIKKDIRISGTIIDFPQYDDKRVRFLFRLDAVPQNERRLPAKIYLSWYQDFPSDLAVNQHWTFTVRLKPVRGLRNPYLFDYEAWLFHKGVTASGYVRRQPEPVLAIKSEQSGHNLIGLRNSLLTQLNKQLQIYSNAGVIKALVLGERRDISAQQWQLLRASGTSHLVAISGLHVGLVAGLAFFLLQSLWRYLPRVPLYWPAPQAAAIGALLAAVIYAALAGFALPTQRALIMLAVIFTGVLWQRHTHFLQVYAVALLLVLIRDPLAVMSFAFWLSYAAVGIIFYSSLRHKHQPSAWLRFGYLQYSISLGLIPLLILFFQVFSLLAPLVNLFAIPLIGFVVVPMVLLASLLGVMALPGGDLLFYLADMLLRYYFLWLAQLQHWLIIEWHVAHPGLLLFSLGCAGVMMMLLPKGVAARYLGIICFLPLLLNKKFPLAYADMELTVLDVGQGTAIIVRTQQHTLVYDTGPRYSRQLDTGKMAVLPYLRALGVRRLDTLVISHADNDHIGGAHSLASVMPPRQLLSGQPQHIDWQQAQQCQAGQHWQWDGVRFEMLYPESSQELFAQTDNNHSCVLKISNAQQQILLTGDIEEFVELQLVRNYRERLKASILLVPHHGSKTSSSEALLDTVQPDYAIFTMAAFNRFGFPHPDVLQRYQARRIQTLNTADDGAIRFYLPGQPAARLAVSRFNENHARYWHAKK